MMECDAEREPGLLEGGYTSVDCESPNKSKSARRISAGKDSGHGSYIECGEHIGFRMIVRDSSLRIDSPRSSRRLSQPAVAKDGDEEEGGDESSDDAHFWSSFILITITVFAVMICAIGWTILGQQDVTEGSALYDAETVEEDIMMKPLYGEQSLEGTTLAQASSSSWRPPLSALVADSQANVIGDVQFLLSFAIVGHSKCGTSFHQQWIGQHEEVQMYEHEMHSLTYGKPAQMVRLLYGLPEGSKYKRGYKSPNDIRTPKALAAIRKYWPKTALIVGLRHPVKWFESYYNSHSLHGKKTLPPAETMVGAKMPDPVRYHIHLSRLGKTNVTDPAEAELLGIGPNIVQPPKMPNPVFLFEVTQPFVTKRGLNEKYRKDLGNFLGLSKPLHNISDEVYASWKNKHYAIDICDDKYQHLRLELLMIGSNSAKWIQSYFMNHPDVTVSSPGQLKALLEDWSIDPCEVE